MIFLHVFSFIFQCHWRYFFSFYPFLYFNLLIKIEFFSYKLLVDHHHLLISKKWYFTYFNQLVGILNTFPEHVTLIECFIFIEFMGFISELISESVLLLLVLFDSLLLKGFKFILHQFYNYLWFIFIIKVYNMNQAIVMSYRR